MKSRLTITLPESLLRYVDGLVDKQTIRNRSHAIEQLIRDSVAPKVQTALILAGGKHVGDKHPLMKKIGEQTLLQQMTQHLMKSGIKQFIFCVQKTDMHLANAAQAAIGSLASVQFSYEETQLGTAGALKKAQALLPNEYPFLVLHADILTDMRIEDICDFHLEQGSKVTMVVEPKLGEKQYGQVSIQGNRITTFSHTGSDSGVNLINTGIYVINPEVLDLISANTPMYLERDIFPQLAKKNQLRAFFFQGLWFDISTDTQYAEACKRWLENV
ncbi:hypothetical protein KA078_03925 [Candidatus Woesebacteria bacterium]|nr:hypothetical protein [Candidatus Woesebacteria bacterium]